MPRKKSTPVAPAASETKATSSPKKRRAQHTKQKSQQSQSIAKKTTKADTTSVPSPSTQPSSSSQAVVDNASPSQTNGQSSSSTSVAYVTARRRPVLEAFIATGAAGIMPYALLVGLQAAVMIGLGSHIPSRKTTGYLLFLWSVSLIVQYFMTLRQLGRSDHYWQRLVALILLSGNPGLLIVATWLYYGFFAVPGQRPAFWLYDVAVEVSVIISILGSLYLWYLLLGTKREIAPLTNRTVSSVIFGRLAKRRRVGLSLIAVAPILPLLLYVLLLVIMSIFQILQLNFISYAIMDVIAQSERINEVVYMTPSVLALVVGIVLVANSQRE